MAHVPVNIQLTKVLVRCVTSTCRYCCGYAVWDVIQNYQIQRVYTRSYNNLRKAFSCSFIHSNSVHVCSIVLMSRLCAKLSMKICMERSACLYMTTFWRTLIYNPTHIHWSLMEKACILLLNATFYKQLCCSNVVYALSTKYNYVESKSCTLVKLCSTNDWTICGRSDRWFVADGWR